MESQLSQNDVETLTQLYSNQLQLRCESDCFDVPENVTILNKEGPNLEILMLVFQISRT